MLNLLFLCVVTLSSIEAVLFEIKNLEIGPIWVGIKGYDGKDIIEDGGFNLASGMSVGTVIVNIFFTD